MTLPPTSHFLNPHFPGFIQHAEGIPFYLKRQKTPGHPPGTSQHHGQGIMLHHPHTYKPGTWLQLTLDVKHIGIKHPEHEINDYVNFDCRVVLVQSLQKKLSVGTLSCHYRATKEITYAGTVLPYHSLSTVDEISERPI